MLSQYYLCSLVDKPNRGRTTCYNLITMKQPTQPTKPTTTPQTKSTTTKRHKPAPKLTRKQLAFVSKLVNNPKMSATQVVKEVYGTPDKPVTELSARNIASENLTKPNIMAELAKYDNTAQITIVEVMNKSKDMMNNDLPRSVDWANTARQTADSILDRIHGKAAQTVHTTSVSLTFGMDLTGSSGTTDPEVQQ